VHSRGAEDGNELATARPRMRGAQGHSGLGYGVIGFPAPGSKKDPGVERKERVSSPCPGCGLGHEAQHLDNRWRRRGRWRFRLRQLDLADELVVQVCAPPGRFGVARGNEFNAQINLVVDRTQVTSQPIPCR